MATEQRAALIKILSKGGEGKSTFLYHIAKTYFHTNLIIWMDELDPASLVDLANDIGRLDAKAPILFLLDNAAIYGNTLIEFAQRLIFSFQEAQCGFRNCRARVQIQKH